MPARLRLNKFLRDCGLGSRRKCESLVTEGRVQINGERAADLGILVDPVGDEVRVDGRVVKPIAERIYLAANKPRGVVVTARDTHGRRTVYDAMPDLPKGVSNVGRLDMDSEGLLLLTNDGKLAFRLCHPRNAIERVYDVEVKGMVPGGVLGRLTEGVEIEDGIARARSAGLVREGEASSVVRVVLAEGRKREVRRMFAACGLDVTSLRRVAFGNVSLGDLGSGRWRRLSRDEVRGLRRLVLEAHVSRKDDGEER
jgi:23S rRNA pseudouridine2605 synthase